jgi:hypothetical protein
MCFLCFLCPRGPSALFKYLSKQDSLIVKTAGNITDVCL